jgi:hypothetical protein
MSRLALFGRPWVVFDAGNKEHRQWFADFNKSGAWGTCPVRFVVDNDHGDLVTMIQRLLIQYYVDKEFGTEKNPRVRPKTVAKKPQSKLAKVVDGLAKRPYN